MVSMDTTFVRTKVKFKMKLLAFVLIISELAVVSLGANVEYIFGDDENFDNSSNREGKVFPFVAVVRLPDETCGTDMMTQGICRTKKQCKKLGGTTVDGVTCGGGYGVCCSFSTSCSSRTNSLTVSVSGTRIKTPSSSTSNAMNPTSCQINLKRPSSDVCQVRLDFIDFDMTGPNDDGECATDFMTITGAENLQQPFVICGKNVNQHLYLQYGTAEIITLAISTSTTTAKYDILASFLQCGSTSKSSKKSKSKGSRSSRTISSSSSSNDDSSEGNDEDSGVIIERAPDGCAQYFTQASGIVQSFNYAGNMVQSVDGPSGQYQTNNQQYTICFKGGSGSTSLKLSPCASSTSSTSGTSTSPFCISGTAGDDSSSGVLTGNNCTLDYVDIPGSLRGRYCGCSFPDSVSTNTKPFLMYVNLNDHETLQPGDVVNPVSGCPLGWECIDLSDTGMGATVEGLCDSSLGYVCSPPEFLSDLTDTANTGFCLKYMVS